MCKIIFYLFWALFASTLTNADNSTTKGHSVFVSGHDDNNVTFAINLPSPSEDIYYYLEGPIENSWLAVGFGDQMKDSLMFLIYRNNNGKNITVSARTADGNSEPFVDRDREVKLLGGSTNNGRYVAKWMCANCRKWSGGFVNITETAQKMIYAAGPSNVQLDTRNTDAGLRRHDWYGKFTINLEQAQGDPDLFQTSFKPNGSDGASQAEGLTDDHDFGSPAHAIFMTGTFVIIFPLGGVWLRIFGSARLHWMTQVLGALIVFIGAAIGIYLSKLFNRAKHYSSPHQIIGFTLLVLLPLQAGLGAAHHRAFKKTLKPTILSKIHRILGPLIIGLGLINGALGFRFASVPRHIIGYAIIIIIVSGMIVVANIAHNRHRRRKSAYETPAARNFQSAYVAPEHQADIPLANAAAPPAYSRPLG